MIKKYLRVIVEEVISFSHQLSSSAEELSAITIETRSKINEQQCQTEQVSAAMNEMSASVQDIAGNISSTAEAVKAVNTETSLGHQLVNQIMDAMNQLSKRIENESLLINKLEQDSTEINSVIAVIRGVVEQTNLLALEAAIEAARAGEQGRGFVVVADEVRSLAIRTQASTEEINQVVEKLQTGSREAVQAMNNSLSEAQSVVDQASQARTS
ncbi:MAG: methyl-accepting chemotaxis protein [Oleiphilaceae bacterium]